MNELPIIKSCDNCSACCLEQQSPPGYLILLSAPELTTEEEIDEDAKRLRELPSHLLMELREYMQQVLAGKEREDLACIWLDKEAMRCRHHEHRPSICRDFEIGSEDCIAWREEFDVV